MSDEELAAVTKEALLARVRSALDRDSDHAEGTGPEESFNVTAADLDDTVLLDIAQSLNLRAQRIYGLSRPSERIPESFKKRFFLLRFKPVEALVLSVARRMFWKQYAMARETAEALEILAAALRSRHDRRGALRGHAGLGDST